MNNNDLFVEYEKRFFCIDCFTTAFSKTLKAVTDKIESDNKNQRLFRMKK